SLLTIHYYPLVCCCLLSVSTPLNESSMNLQWTFNESSMNPQRTHNEPAMNSRLGFDPSRCLFGVAFPQGKNVSRNEKNISGCGKILPGTKQHFPERNIFSYNAAIPLEKWQNAP
ncbi:MAG: hypothetical protein IJR64_02090, partial [Bacteroidales bacterium]|nr:hypothetical protein [Bacteroidales bacterium]